MFRAADLMLISKADLLAVLDDFDPAAAERHLRNLASRAPVISVAARKQRDIDGWLDWLRAEVVAQRGRVMRGETTRPALQPEGRALHAHPDAAPPHRFVRMP
jgi:hydrogenase nickel incorporation protein HypB